MIHLRLIPLFLGITLWVGAAPKAQEPANPFPPGLIHANESVRRAEKSLGQDLPKPAVPIPDWAKAQTDAARLRTLAQEIERQIQSGPAQLPAPLNGELKEMQKVIKRLRRELLF